MNYQQILNRLNFGGTLKGSLQHTLGKIECEGKAKNEGMPKSCEDLWRMGHTLNGIFAVRGSKSIESLYCDFNRRPNENGIEYRVYRVLNFTIHSLTTTCFMELIFNQVSRNGLDTLTSNQTPSISTSREILHLTQNTIRFRSTSRG